jgi:hypothetical protein
MHAVCITAYKDYPALRRLVTRLDRGFFRIFIHIDKAGEIGSAERVELERLGATVMSRHRIRWGSISHLDAILDLLREAVRGDGLDYVHLISGQDYPLAGPQEFERRCDGRIFMNFEHFDHVSADVRERHELWNVFASLQTGTRVANGLYRCLDGPSRWIQKRLGLRRSRFGPFATVYKGIVWMSLPMKAARQLLEDPAAAGFHRAVRTTYVAEEIFFQTYFLNSDLSASVVNDDLRYTDWHYRNGSIPAYLDESDLDPMLRAEALFARKVSSDISATLLDQIDTARFEGGGARRTA